MPKPSELQELPFEMVVIQGDKITPSLLVWRRYKRKAVGIVERMLFDNPHILEPLSQSPFLPVGAVVRVAIDQAVINGDPVTKRQVRLWGES